MLRYSVPSSEDAPLWKHFHDSELCCRNRFPRSYPSLGHIFFPFETGFLFLKKKIREKEAVAHFVADLITSFSC